MLSPFLPAATQEQLLIVVFALLLVHVVCCFCVMSPSVSGVLLFALAAYTKWHCFVCTGLLLFSFLICKSFFWCRPPHRLIVVFVILFSFRCKHIAIQASPSRRRLFCFRVIISGQGPPWSSTRGWLLWSSWVAMMIKQQLLIIVIRNDVCRSNYHFPVFWKHDSQFPNVTFSAYIKKHNYYSSY